MSDAWERLCESVSATPETVFAGYKFFTRQPDPPAYLRKPERKRWRGLIRAALGKREMGHYRFHVECRHDAETVREFMRERAEYRRRTDELCSVVGEARLAMVELARAWSAAMFGSVEQWARTMRKLKLDGEDGSGE